MKTPVAYWQCVELISLLLFASIDSLTGQRLVGVTFRKWPYVERSLDLSHAGNGNRPDRWLYSGYFVELLNEIKEIKREFEYELYFARDGLNELVKMDTLIQELNAGRAHFAIADLTVTDLHRHSVDFTEPFMAATTAAIVHKSNACGLRTLADLANQTDLEFGAVAGSITNYELNGDDPVQRRLFDAIAQKPSLYVNTLDEGLTRVNETRFALLSESVAVEFYARTHCELTVIGGGTGGHWRPYAIALRKGSPYLGWFNSAILALKREGVLDDLRAEFWQNDCPDDRRDYYYCGAGVKSTLTEANSADGRAVWRWWPVVGVLVFWFR